MEDMLELSNYFSNGRAESEIDFLDDVYFASPEFNDFIQFPSRTIRILIGKKGTGKSALMEVMKVRCERSSIPCLFIKPDDFPIDLPNEYSIAQLKADIFNKLLKKLAIECSSKLSAFVDKDSKAVIEEGIIEGVITPDKVKKLKSILLPVATGLSNVDFEKIFGSRTYTTYELKKGVESLSGRIDKYFYLLVDDTDQISSLQKVNYLETIWALILGVQKIAEELPNIKPIISIREEIWNRLRNDENGLRDQIDHFRTSVRYIYNTEEQIENILIRRLEYCKKIFHPAMKQSAMECFFDGKMCTLPTSEEKRSWKDYLVTSSRSRPRDTVQLINMLASNAYRRRNNSIDSVDVSETALEYSKERVQDLRNENTHIVPELESIIKSFSILDFENPADKIMQHLKSIPGLGGLTINRKVIKSEDDNTIFLLWKFLYDCEFLTPKIKDASRSKGYRFIRPREDLNLVEKSNWTNMQKYIWTIHPAYRSYILNEKYKEDLRR